MIDDDGDGDRGRRCEGGRGGDAAAGECRRCIAGEEEEEERTTRIDAQYC